MQGISADTEQTLDAALNFRRRGQNRAALATGEQAKFIEAGMIEDVAGGDGDEVPAIFQRHELAFEQNAGRESGEKFFGGGDGFQIDIGKIERGAEAAQQAFFGKAVGLAQGVFQRRAVR